MRLYRSIDETTPVPGRPRSVAIGIFDGVHNGHRQIVERAVAAAEAVGGIATVLTFEPHPSVVLDPEHAPELLTPLEAKVDLLEEAGVQEVVALPFDRRLAQLSPGEFCRVVLSDRLGARQVVVGRNFRFGRGGSGTPEDLLAYGRERGFSVTAVGLHEQEGGPVSSTRIRGLLNGGKVDEAARLLGRPHFLEGFVVSGAGRGRDLGSPTANIASPEGLVVPAEGVYVTRTSFGSDHAEPSVTSVGTNPTFTDHGPLTVETFLLGFRGSLYGVRVRVAFLQWLRGQITFPDSDSLIRQIESDVAEARAFFQREGNGARA
jgi:riboflavin kinase/FMN adenylyltransferase